MKTLFKKSNLGLLLITLSFFALGFFARNVHSQSAFLPFGGQLIGEFPCTCSAALYLLYLPAQPMAFNGGPLAYLPYATITYSYYNIITPGVKHLGLYTPGVQSCWMYAGFGCFPLPVIGSMFEVGTTAWPTE